MTLHRFILIAAMASALCGLTACALPTESASVVDMRPQVTFKVESTALDEARVLIDGLDSGRLGDFKVGQAALRVLPGNHVVKVQMGDRVVHEERVYLGDGVSRTLLVK
ncbi:MAG: hypothetical protein ACM32J_05870 [Rhizobacter sp.]|jgi:hypothetical protein